MNPGDILKALRHGWWLAPLTLAATLIASGYLTDREVRLYRADASIVISPAPGIENVGDVLRALETLERRSVLATIVELVKSPSVQRTARDELGWAESAGRGFRVTASVLPHANVVRINTEGPDAEGAAALAQAIAHATAVEAERLFTPYAVATLKEPRVATVASHPDVRRNYLVAGVLGACLGAGLAYLYGLIALSASRPAWFRPVRLHVAD